MLRSVALTLVLLATLLWSPAAFSWQTPSQTFPETGYTVADTAQGRFLSEFRRLGGVDAFGYPISDPFQTGGFTYQAFQRAVLQWRPELNQALLANTLDWLSDAGKDPWLAQTYQIPGPLKDSGGSWEQVVAERESWLTEPAVAKAYRDGGGLNRFGLPTSKPEPRGPFTVQRFQRYIFQLWTQDVAGMPPRGSVVGVLVGDILKQAGLIGSTPTPPAPTAAPSPVASVDCKVEIKNWGIKKTSLYMVEGQGEVVNLCPYPVDVSVDLVTTETNDRPTGDGNSVNVRNVPAGGAITFKLTAQATLQSTKGRYIWAWAQADLPDLVCLQVQSAKCLRHDVWLGSALWQIRDQNAEGLALLKLLAEHEVRIVRGTTNTQLFVEWDRATKTIKADYRLDETSAWVRAAYLAHALQHAADDLTTSGKDCTSYEQAAYKRASEVWRKFWWGGLPSGFTDLHKQLNDMAEWVQNDPTGFAPTLMRRHGSHC